MMGNCYVFGPFVLNSATGSLLRQGEPVAVGYRGFRLLTSFLERPGEVLSKSDLIDTVWEGAAVEEGNLSVQIASLRKLLGQTPSGGDWIATVPRVGYRFVGAVDYKADTVHIANDVSLIAENGGGPSIAVLPFVNLSGDPAQEYFSDGMVEDIITGLSRLHWLFVIARNSTYTYKGTTPDIRKVATELGVRYILEGSVRRADDRLRVSSQLIDTSTGTQVWAERYDRATTDIFAVQDEITESVVASIEPQLYAAENRRFQTKPPESLDAWAYVMRAMPHIWTWAEQKSETALADLRHAIGIEPDYARAHSLLAWTYITGSHMGWGMFSDVSSQALESAHRAVECDSEDPWAHLALGYVHMLSRQFMPAIEELSEALRLNPNFALGHMVLGAVYGFGGAGDDGLPHLALGMRLSPRDPHQAFNQSASALCHFVAKRYEESITLNRRAVLLRPRFTSAWRSLAAGAGIVGDIDTAASALTKTKQLQPDLSVDWVEKHHPIVRPEDRAIYIEGLRKAGLR
jgi:TolB-like protein/tetratricopeptide (TPR) repeat protein